ncbi:hypothetical protein NQZ68_010541 [Dissostichus eleginoides]|nr:hypothetical protein NQZ68_010541 [Dissostichus eleginoides]
MSSLFEQGVLQKSEFGAAGVVPVVVQTAGLTVEQQRELLAMQFEQEKLRLEEDRLQLQLEQEKLEQEKLQLEFRLEQEKLQLEFRLEQEKLQEKLELRGQQQEVEKRLEVEKMKCEVEHARLRLIGEGKLSSVGAGPDSSASGSGDRSVLGVIGDVEKMVAIPAVVQSFHQAPPVDLQVRGDPRAPM